MNDKIGLKIRMLDNLIQKNICRLVSQKGASEITYMNFWIINYIHECSPRAVYQKDIEQTLAINRATASKMLTTMEKKGLISREVSEEDGRMRKIVLRPDALLYYDQHKEVVEELEHMITKGLTQEDIKSFFKVYDVMKRNLDI
ncbi:MAG: MarR family transcriptional regulator [Lachnospiraceae bacterium]|nr:MarR family transcriptional regulator [Lachnospiraceae bacterium]